MRSSIRRDGTFIPCWQNLERKWIKLAGLNASCCQQAVLNRTFSWKIAIKPPRNAICLSLCDAEYRATCRRDRYRFSNSGGRGRLAVDLSIGIIPLRNGQILAACIFE